MATEKEIKSVANELITQFTSGVAPVGIEQLAIVMGLAVRYETFEDAVSGFLLAKDSSGTVFINKSHHPNRQRFTIAHEIGHYKLHFQSKERLFYDTKFSLYHRAKPTDNTTATTTPVEEKEANIFASHILMPDSMLKKVFLERTNLFGDESDISLLASLFQVSEIAMSIRLESFFKLNEIPKPRSRLLKKIAQ